MTGTYEIIYADPPWRYSAKKVQGAAENHYPTMSIDELCALPVAELAAKDSALFMWATFPQLPEALRLIRAWGFTYKSVAFVWLKKNKKADSWFYGLGFWTRANAEVCLLATKGHPKRQAADIHQFIISPIEAHSKKPDATRWSRQRASGHGGQKIAERRTYLALCECSQRSFQDQDENCL